MCETAAARGAFTQTPTPNFFAHPKRWELRSMYIFAKCRETLHLPFYTGRDCLHILVFSALPAQANALVLADNITTSQRETCTYLSPCTWTFVARWRCRFPSRRPTCRRRSASDSNRRRSPRHTETRRPIGGFQSHHCDCAFILYVMQSNLCQIAISADVCSTHFRHLSFTNSR